MSTAQLHFTRRRASSRAANGGARHRQWQPSRGTATSTFCLLVLVALSAAPHVASHAPPPLPPGVAASTPTALDTPEMPSLQDPCTLVGFQFASKLSVRPSEYKACLTTFPFKREEADAVLDTVWKVLVNLYPYVNIARNSPTPAVPLKVRLRKELIRMKQQSYASEYEFHKDLYEVVNSLEDGHTGWSATCHTVGQAFTAFPLVQVYDAGSGTARIKISPHMDLETLENSTAGAIFGHTEQILGASVQAYAGAEVLAINGVPALEYVERLASTAGTFRDQQARINSLFLRPAALAGTYFPGGFMRLNYLPDNDTITYTILREHAAAMEQLEVPYIVRYGGEPFSSAAEYYERNCKPSAPVAEAEAAAAEMGARWREEPRTRHHKPRERPMIRHREVPDFMKAESFGFRALSNETDDVQVYLLSDNATAVMTVPDFMGSAASDANLTAGEAVVAFLDQLLTAYSTVRDSGASRLLIDVSNNGGGFVITGSFLTQLLFPDAGDPQFSDQFKAPLLAQAAYLAASAQNGNSTSDYNYAAWVNPHSGEKFARSSEFFLPLVDVTQNNITAQFSSLFHDKDYFALIGGLQPGLLPTTPLFQPENIIVLSNGLCYSTCGVFTYQLRQRHNVKVVTVGGRHNSGPFAFAAGTVGFVVEDFDSFYQSEVVALGLHNETYTPQPLPVKGTLRWTMAQTFGPRSSTVPQEFIYEPGQIKLPYTEANVLSLPTLWNQVAGLFPTAGGS